MNAKELVDSKTKELMGINRTTNTLLLKMVSVIFSGVCIVEAHFFYPATTNLEHGIQIIIFLLGYFFFNDFLKIVEAYLA